MTVTELLVSICAADATGDAVGIRNLCQRAREKLALAELRPTGHNKRKVIHIAAAFSNLYALDSSGQLWTRRNPGWEPVELPPGCAIEDGK
jgi:hypothetical protein